MLKTGKRLEIILLGVVLLLAVILRVWQLDKNPVSLFGDELDVGYQAYSILKTGRDYYGNFLPIHFHSLAEWRTPLYLYASVPTVALFGISPWGVRLPAAFFGVFSILALYLLVKQMTKDWRVALVAGLVLTISPWHIQYSRGGFEATQLLFFLILGLYFFFKALEDKGKSLWISAGLLCLTPWVYSTAKLFTPLLLIFLFLVWRRDVLSFPKKYLLAAVAALLIVGTPIAFSTLFGGGAQRFNYLSVFTDPTTETEVGVARQTDARMRGELGTGLKPTIVDRAFHNKFTLWGGAIIKNFFLPFSTDFLFIKGDLNMRHSVGVGEFYKVEALALTLGLIFFFTKFRDKKIKAFVVFWLLAGVIPAAITRDGGMHATRLILILPPLVLLISYGLVASWGISAKKYRKPLALGYTALLLLGFIAYQHYYWVHYPWDSERWWHAGFKESIQSIKAIDKNYSKIVISSAGEPPWIFFAGWYEYPPAKWQRNFPIGNDIEVAGFGKVSHIDKFYFGSPQKDVGIYGIGRYLDGQSLYLAVAKEIGANLIMEPQRTPPDLTLVKAIPYPSGELAFYLFAGKTK